MIDIVSATIIRDLAMAARSLTDTARTLERAGNDDAISRLQTKYLLLSEKAAEKIEELLNDAE